MIGIAAAETSGPIPSPGINVIRCDISVIVITRQDLLNVKFDAFVKLSSECDSTNPASVVSFRPMQFKHALDTLYTVRYKAHGLL